MRLVPLLGLALAGSATVAAADPGCVQPLALPALPLWSPDDHQELAIHVGLAAMAIERPFGTVSSGPAFDLEIGLRHRWLSLLLYGDASYGAPGAFGATDVRAIGWGVRGRAHSGGLFFGVGAGIEFVHKPNLQLDSDDGNLVIVEVQAGYTLPKLGPLAPELQAVIEWDPFDTYNFTSTRVEIGAMF